MLTTSMPVVGSPAFAAVCEEMVGTVRLLSARGWTPATSSNFSARIPLSDNSSAELRTGLIAISRSGIDKAMFSAADIMVVDREGMNVWPEGARSSAETPLHTLIYDLYDAGAVLHTHSVLATLYSMRHTQEGWVRFSGLELLKGFSGIHTHATGIDVPIFPNDQDMPRLAERVGRDLTARFSSVKAGSFAGSGSEPRPYGFLIEGHGLYTWGADLGEARRHLEVFEFLFDLSLRMEDFNGAAHHS